MAIRKGDWKLVRYDGTGTKLYNLARDIGEKDDLAMSEPARVKELQTTWNAWNKTLARPLWGAAKGGKKAGKGAD